MDPDLLVKVGVIVAVLALLWVLPDLGRYRDRVLRVGRAPRNEPSPTHPSGPPVEQIAADAQRIRAQIREAPPGVPVARMRGWLEAYDDVLVTACQALGLEERLGDLPEGAERDLERKRVERTLEGVGVLLRSSA
ncbi:MAG: hypothetical protein M3237_15960 [Actinomycetota bacterium]|nr:hypothetical protein [Actinomycetota bacterium]